MSTMAQDSLALFTDNSITLPAACSKNAFELKVQVVAPVAGTLSAAQCTAVGEAVKNDLAEAAVAGDPDRIGTPSIECSTSRRRLNDHRRWLSSTTTNVAVTAELFSGDQREAEAMKTVVASGVDLDATAAAAASAGAPLASSSASATVTQDVAANPDATGTVVIPNTNNDMNVASTAVPSIVGLMLTTIAAVATLCQ